MPKLNLRQAHVVRRALETAMKTRLATEVTINVSIFDLHDRETENIGAQVERILSEKRSDVLTGLDKQSRLVDILYRLRSAISAENVAVCPKSGYSISDTLNQLARLDAQIQLYTNQVSTHEGLHRGAQNQRNTKRLEAIVRAEQKDAGSVFDSGTDASFSVCDDGMMSLLKSRLIEARRERQKFDDIRMGLNFRSEIEIGDDDYALLAEVGIV